MSGLWGIHPAAAAAGAAAVGAGVTHAYHSSGASRPRRRSNQATFVVERGKDTSARAKRLVSSDAAGATAVSETAASGARAVATGAGTAATTVTFPVASRARPRRAVRRGRRAGRDRRASSVRRRGVIPVLAGRARSRWRPRARSPRATRAATIPRATSRAGVARPEGSRGHRAAAAAGDAGPPGLLAGCLGRAEPSPKLRRPPRSRVLARDPVRRDRRGRAGRRRTPRL